MPVIYTTANQVEIHVENGSKSPNDFIVRYREPNKRVRTPKHIHLIVDLFAKRTGNLPLTNALLDHIIRNIILKVEPAVSFPPSLQIFKPAHINQFHELSEYGEYSIEFLLVMIELIMIQEKTNYPDGTINLDLFQKFRDGADIFSIVSAATFR
ncbi:MAG: hypothetical protein LDL50_04045 [Chloroflexi bacterium]|nr:hypothetical protein [Chloroflexota bacterium]MCA2001500.1 hypothetical protein [Chloroflexota bacterium]